MRFVPLIIVLLTFVGCKHSEITLLESQVKLCAPQVSLDSIFFHSSAKVEVDYRVENSLVKYSIDNSSYEHFNDNTLSIRESSSLRFCSLLSDYKPSDTILIQAYKLDPDLEISNVRTSIKASDSYPGTGSNGLIDGKKAELSFRSQHWLGYDQDSIIIDLNLENTKEASELILSTLYDQKSWIFSPAKVQVLNRGNMIGEWHSKPSSEPGKAHFEFIKIPLDKQKHSELKIILHRLKSIPNWHPGKGLAAWLFIDEILVN